MRYLLATDSVHTTAAACDYLQDRAGSDDHIRVVHVQSDADEQDSSSPGSRARQDAGDARDGREALNVATVRLGAVADVETEQRSGAPAAELLAAAAEVDADEIVLGVRGGDPGAESAVGSTTRAVLGEADRPVVVVPQETL
mgnify:CR=1 FL=1